MTSVTPYRAVLTCHPETHGQAVRGIEAGVCWTQSEALALTYSLKGELARLRIPPLRLQRRADRLWQHTCFEAFVSEKGKAPYHEFNFSPSGEWAAYAFRSYRDGLPLEDDELAPGIGVQITGNSLELNAIVRLNRLRTLQSSMRLQLALSAVIEENDGMRSYWALKHPAGEPDFHHPDAFVLEIKPSNEGVT